MGAARFMTNVIVSMPTVHTLQHVNGVTDGCCISASPMFLVHGLTFGDDVDAVLIRSARTRAPQDCADVAGVQRTLLKRLCKSACQRISRAKI